MNVIGVRPNGPLSDYIYWFAYYDGFTAEDRGFRMIPEGTVDVLIPLEGQATISAATRKEGAVDFGEPMVVGPQRSYSIYDTSKCNRAFGIVFTPGGAARFLRLPIGELTDSFIPARAVFGAAFAVLHERLLEERDPSRMFGMAETFLRERFDPELRYAEEIGYATSVIRSGRTDHISLVDFAETTIGFSHKHFVELFRRQVGLGPKRYQQIVRFNHMLERRLLSPRITWQQLATAFGYADSSHLFKDFGRFAGMTPASYQKATWTHRQVLSETGE